MKRLIQRLMWGPAASGVPLSQIRSTVHTYWPPEMVPATKMHQVILKWRKEVHEKLRDTD